MAALVASMGVLVTSAAEPDTDEPPQITFALVTHPNLYAISDVVVERVPNEDDSAEQQPEALRRDALATARVLGDLHAILAMRPRDVLTAPDPSLALDVLQWSVDAAGQFTDAVQDNGVLLDRMWELDDFGAALEASSEDPLGLGVASGTKFEASLGSLMSGLQRYMQDPGDGEESNESGVSDVFEQYLIEPVPPGADPDPDDPDRDANGDQWEDYLNEKLAPGAPPDLPEDDDDAWDDDEAITVEDGTVLWVDEDTGEITVDNPGEVEEEDGEADDGGADGADDGQANADDGAADDGDADNGEADGDGAGDGVGDGTGDDDADEDANEDADGTNGADAVDEQDGGGADGDPDEQGTPCDPDIGGCGGGGELPDDSGDPSSGTTQPGEGQGQSAGLPALPDDGGFGPLILVGPEQTQGSQVVVVLRPPGYGLTQPGAYHSAGFWQQDAAVIEDQLNTLFAAAAHEAARLEELCGRDACR